MADNNSFLAKSVKVELTTDLTKYEQGIAKAELDLKRFTDAVKENKKEQAKLQEAIEKSKSEKGEDTEATEKLIKELEDLKKAESRLEKDINNTNLSIQQQSKDMLNSINASNQMSKGFDAVKVATLAVKAALLSMTAVKLKEWLIDSNAQWEIYESNLSTILQSTAKANVLLENLSSFAQTTPFEISGLVEASQQLLAFGVSTDDIILRLQQLGDLSQGQEDIFTRITNAYGKMQAKQKVSLEELNMLTEAGVPILKELQNVLNTDSQTLFTMISNGAVDVNDINDAFKNLTSEGGQFYGLMEKQSQTLTGMLSNMDDFIGTLGRNLGEEAFDKIKDALSDLMNELDRMEKTGELQEIVENLADGLATTADVIINLIKLIYEYKDVIALAGGAWITYQAAIKAAGLAQAAYKTVVIATTTATTAQEIATKATTVAQLKLNTAMAAAAVAIAIVTTAVIKANTEWDSYRESADKVINNNKDIAKSYETQNAEIDKNNIKMEEYMNKIKSLSSSEEDFKRNKSEIATLIEKVNGLYPELELGINNEGNALNKTSQEIEKYVNLKNEQSKAIAAQQTLQGLYDSQTDIYAEAKMLANELNVLTEEQEKLREASKGKFLFTDEGQAYDEISRKIAAKKEALRDLQLTYDSTTLTIEQVAEEFNKYGQTLDDTTNKISDNASEMTNYKNSVTAVSEEIKNIQDSISKLSTEMEYFDGVIKSNKESLGLNKDQILELINKYPEIASKITETSDGYKIENGVLETLRNTKQAQMTDAINAEISMAQQTVASTQDRLNAIQQEITGISNLAQAKAKLAQLEATRTNLLTEDLGGKNRSTGNQDVVAVDDDIAKAKEAINLYEELSKESSKIDALKESLTISGSSKGSGTSRSNSGSGSKSQGESAQEIELRNLKFSYSMGLIETEEYYKKLSTYSSKYYKTGSKEWQQYSLEIKNGWDKLNKDIYNSQNKGIENKISDGEFYGTISYNDYKSYYSQLLSIAKNANKKGIIDEEEYADRVNKINKDLYSKRKEYIQDYYNTQSDLVSKAYEKARKEINRYYDDIDKREQQDEYNKQLSDIDSDIERFSNAKTGAGLKQLEELKTQREELVKEMARTERDYDKASSLEVLEEKYTAWQDSQKQVFENVSTYAEDTTNVLISLSQRVSQTISEMNAMANSGYQMINNTKNVNIGLTNNNNLQTQSDFEVLMRQSSTMINYGLQF